MALKKKMEGFAPLQDFVEGSEITTDDAANWVSLLSELQAEKVAASRDQIAGALKDDIMLSETALAIRAKLASFKETC